MPWEDEEDPREPLASVADPFEKEEDINCCAELDLGWLL